MRPLRLIRSRQDIGHGLRNDHGGRKRRSPSMRLSRRLTIALVVGITLVMAANAMLQVRREAQLFDLDSRRDQLAIGRVLKAAVQAIWPAEGEAAAQRLIAEASRDNPQLTMRLVWLAPDAPEAVAPLVGQDGLATVMGGEEIVITTRERRVTYLPLAVDPARPGALEVSEPLEPERVFVRATALMVAATTLVMVAFCAALALGLGFWFVGRPMQALCDKARRVGAGDFSGPLEVAQRDEIGELAGELNAMCDRLASATAARMAALEQLRHADRL
jgi:two-component system NtrC family sensor kinase